MFGFRSGANRDEVAELREELGNLRVSLAEMRANVDALAQAVEAARVDYAELAATAYRHLKRAEAVRRSAEREQQEETPQGALELVPDLPVSTPLRNTRLARAATARRGSEG